MKRKKGRKELSVKINFLTVRTRAYLQAMSVIVIRRHGGLSNHALCKVLIQKYLLLFNKRLPVDLVTEFICREKENKKQGLLRGPNGKPSSLTVVREENIDGELKFLIDKVQDEFDISENDVFELLGVID